MIEKQISQETRQAIAELFFDTSLTGAQIAERLDVDEAAVYDCMSSPAMLSGWTGYLKPETPAIGR